MKNMIVFTSEVKIDSCRLVTETHDDESEMKGTSFILTKNTLKDLVDKYNDVYIADGFYGYLVEKKEAYYLTITDDTYEQEHLAKIEYPPIPFEFFDMIFATIIFNRNC